MSNYLLEIYLPNNYHEPLIVLRSDVPFLCIQSGDFIDPRAYDLGENIDLQDKLLRIISVKHFITVGKESKTLRHHVNIYTEAVPNKAQTLF